MQATESDMLLAGLKTTDDAAAKIAAPTDSGRAMLGVPRQVNQIESAKPFCLRNAVSIVANLA
jgi:hypothetical protein